MAYGVLPKIQPPTKSQFIMYDSRLGCLPSPRILPLTFQIFIHLQTEFKNITKRVSKHYVLRLKKYRNETQKTYNLSYY